MTVKAWGRRETAGSYASLLETFATGDQLNEVSATDRFITVVHKHQAALGKTETRRELNDTAYTLEALAQSAGGTPLRRLRPAAP